MSRHLERHEMIRQPRHQHVDNVTPIRRNVPVEMFDRGGDEVPDDFVKVPRDEAQHIAGLLLQAAPHLPSRRAVDAAVFRLTGHPSARPSSRQGRDGRES